MTILPSPIPHPLDLLPWELPGWVYEGLEWVIGVEWPEGNEKEVWDLADQWFAAASALVGPRDDAFAAAGEVLSGYGGTGAVGAAFDEAWRKVAEGDDAPLIMLLTVSHELGKLVEECGCDIEGAKIEVWIQVGILVVELLALAVAVALTLGAASPAAGAAMAATRAVIQQIFKRLVAQLARKALKKGVKEAAERAAKEVSERGLKKFAKKALREGLEEAGEELGTDLGTQTYQNTTGRRDGLDVASLGMSALGGFAGGAGASLAGLGRHASSRAGRFGENIGREMGGEVLGETAAGLATGNGLPGFDDLARAATSGASSSTVSQTAHTLDHNFDSRFNALSGLPSSPVDLAGPAPAVGGPTSTAVDPSPGSTSPNSAAPSPMSTNGSSTTYAASTYAASTYAGPVAESPQGPAVVESTQAGSEHPGSTRSVRSDVGLAGVAGTVDPLASAAATPANAAGATSPVAQSPGSHSQVTVNQGTVPATAAAPVNVPVSTSTAVSAGLTTAAAPASAVTTSIANPTSLTNPTSPTTAPPPNTQTSAPTTSAPTNSAPTNSAPTNSAPTSIHPSASPTTSPHSSSATSARSSISDALRPDRSGPSSPAPSTPDPRPLADSSSTPRPADDPPTAIAPPSPRLVAIREGLDRRGYRGYARSQREQHEQRRREDEAVRLRAEAEVHENRARSCASQAIQLERAGQRQLASQWSRAADAEARRCYALQDQAQAVLDGTLSPQRVDIADATDFRRINDDVGNLAAGPVQTGNRSALTGTDHPPSIDGSRRYGERGGLRLPLALHQTDLERHMPRDESGNVVRTADPRHGRWFRLANDGGSRADPTRSINCLDCSLSFFETWVHGRPRVSAPRTFDGYSGGNINYPVDGEADGPGRAEDITGGRFQQLCPDVRQLAPAAAQQVVQGAYADLQAQLLAGGHGSYAFVVNTWEGGASHAWVAVNQDGTVLYLDPQSGRISAGTPLYPHYGTAYGGNVTSFDALVLDSNARPMPLANRPPGMFTARPPRPPPTPTPPITPPPAFPPVTVPPVTIAAPVVAAQPAAQPGPSLHGGADINRVHVLDDSPPLTVPAQTPAGPLPAGPAPDPAGQPKPADRARDSRRRAHADRTGAGVSVETAVRGAVDLASVFEAGVRPAEVVAHLDQMNLLRLSPQLNEADARDVARFFAEPRVQRMLDQAWQAPPRGEPMLAEALVHQLTGRVDLVRMIQASPELANSLTARPLTLHHLASHQAAIDALGSVLDDIAARGADAVVAEGVADPAPTPLTGEQVRISSSIEVVGESAFQPGFDPTRRGDPAYRAAYLDQLYQAAAVAQEEVSALARRISNDGQPGGGKPGWRTRPKDRGRAEDKIDGYDGDVSHLTDLAGAKIEFHNLADLYRALDRLRCHPDVRVVAFNDRFLQPQESGYRDVQLTLRTSNGHLAEFRLHLAALDDVAVWEHALYEVRRDLKALARQQERPMTAGERAIRTGVVRSEQLLFWQALQSTFPEVR